VATAPDRYSLPEGYDHSWASIATGRISCLLPCLIMRRSTLARVGLMNDRLRGAEDFEYYVRLFMDRPDGVHCFPEYIYEYRIYSASYTKAAENCMSIVDSTLQVLEWLFAQERILEEITPYRSSAYASCLRYLAKERLLHGQRRLCRRVVRLALREPNLTTLDWLRACLPIALLSMLPAPCTELARRTRSALEQHAR
jgi:hypothetical protein